MVLQQPAPPLRTCVGCGKQGARSDLLRVVAESGPGTEEHPRRAVPDPDRVLPGRGANLHPDLTCLDRAERRRALARALRVPAPLDATTVREHLEHLATEQAGSPMSKDRSSPDGSRSSR